MKKFIINNTQLRKIYEATVTPKIVVPFDGNSVSDAVSAIDNPNVQKQLNTAQSAAGDCTIALQGSNYQDNGPTQSVKKDSGSSWGDAMTQQINPELFQQNPSAELNDTIDEGVKFTKKEIMERRKKKLKENYTRFTKKQLKEVYNERYEDYTTHFNGPNDFNQDIENSYTEKINKLKGEYYEVKTYLVSVVENIKNVLDRYGLAPSQVLFYKCFNEYKIEYHIPWVPTDSDEDSEIDMELHSLEPQMPFADSEVMELFSIDFWEGDERKGQNESVIEVTFEITEEDE